MWLLAAVVAVASVCLAAPAVAGAAGNLVTNGDFETGDLTGWTTFTTPNGTLGTGFPTVAMFDTTGTGASNAAKFEVGEVSFTGLRVGGGIYQSVTTPASLFSVSADTAVLHTFAAFNTDCGLFELLVDGQVVASHAYGQCFQNVTVRFTLSATGLALTAGSHEIRIRMTRPFIARLNQTPFQYVDNVTLTNTTEQAISDLQDLVASMGIHHGITNALESKLQNALDALAADDTAAACYWMQSFVGLVNAQTGKKITAGQAMQLIDAATDIQTQLDC
jgi:hypothetical protein